MTKKKAAPKPTETQPDQKSQAAVDEIVKSVEARSERVVFEERENGPERLVCEASIHFQGGQLKGMKLVGFSLWRSPEGEIYVTFPSRAFGAGSDRRFFDYLRSVDGNSADAKRVKAWILDEFHHRTGALADYAGQRETL